MGIKIVGAYKHVYADRAEGEDLPVLEELDIRLVEHLQMMIKQRNRMW